ncbi:uncharacterized protein METZ01_LOCUS73076, partial [marine metagenome]
ALPLQFNFADHQVLVIITIHFMITAKLIVKHDGY